MFREIYIIICGLIFLCHAICTKITAFKFIDTILGITFFSVGLFILSYTKGEKAGAYNQLKGKYEIIYEYEDSCVVDTIIKLK